MTESTDVTRVILALLAEGRSSDDVLRMRPYLTPDDIRRAARDALNALDGAPRIESRAERIERVRKTHPRAFEPWGEDEDAHVLRRHEEGASQSQIARELGRPPGAVRARLDKWLGPSWRERGVDPPGGAAN